MPMSFIMSKNVEHSSEKTPRELMDEVCKSHTSVISAHFFDQIHVFSFLCTALLSRLDSKPTVNSRTCRHLGKEYLDDNFHQSLLKDSENH